MASNEPVSVCGVTFQASLKSSESTGGCEVLGVASGISLPLPFLPSPAHHPVVNQASYETPKIDDSPAEMDSVIASRRGRSIPETSLAEMRQGRPGHLFTIRSRLLAYGPLQSD